MSYLKDNDVKNNRKDLDPWGNETHTFDQQIQNGKYKPIGQIAIEIPSANQINKSYQNRFQNAWQIVMIIGLACEEELACWDDHNATKHDRVIIVFVHFACIFTCLRYFLNC